MFINNTVTKKGAISILFCYQNITSFYTSVYTIKLMKVMWHENYQSNIARLYWSIVRHMRSYNKRKWQNFTPYWPLLRYENKIKLG